MITITELTHFLFSDQPFEAVVTPSGVPVTQGAPQAVPTNPDWRKTCIKNKHRWYRLGLILVLILGEVGGTTVHAQMPPVSLTRGPYLQSLTPTSVLVVWETDVPGSSRVDYGPTADHTLFVENAAAVTHHALMLTGLNPNSVVHYQVATAGQPLGQDCTFRTAMAPPSSYFTFAVMGDTRSNPEAHHQVVERLLAQSPVFYLHTGDLVADGDSVSDWDTFFSVEQDLLCRVPLLSVLGNHEHGSPLYFEALHLPGNERWYSFDYGNVHLVALDLPTDDTYLPDAEQFRWLADDLSRTRQPWKMVFFHVPLYSSGPHGSNLSARAVLEPLFIQYGVALVFSGHDHDYERSVANGITYVVTGGGGAPLYEPTTENSASVYFTTTTHAVLVNVAGPRLTVSALRPDGVIFDTFTLQALSRYTYLPVILKRQ